MANAFDIVVAKARGFEKSMEAHRDGLVGVFQTLAKQHGEVGALIDRVRNNASKREPLWPMIAVELMAHERAELEAVFRALEATPQLRPYVERHAREASELTTLISRLNATAMAGEEWMSLFDQLGDTVAANVAEEEHEMFPAALAAIGEQHAKQLDDRFKAAYKRLRATLEKTRQ
jgi:Hemerythrin HHE cation binding domain